MNDYQRGFAEALFYSIQRDLDRAAFELLGQAACKKAALEAMHVYEVAGSDDRIDLVDIVDEARKAFVATIEKEINK